VFFIREEEVLEVVFEEPVEGRASGPTRPVGWSAGFRLLADRAGGGLHRTFRIGIEKIGGR